MSPRASTGVAGGTMATPSVAAQARRTSQSAREYLVGLRDRNRQAGQLDAEGRAAALLAADRDRAAVCLDDPLRDRQAEAGARDAGAACARCPEEGREHLREVALGDADAAVGYLQPRGGVVGVDPELDPASRRRELERVRDQVVEHLSQARAVAVDQR